MPNTENDNTRVIKQEKNEHKLRRTQTIYGSRLDPRGDGERDGRNILKKLKKELGIGVNEGMRGCH